VTLRARGVTLRANTRRSRSHSLESLSLSQVRGAFKALLDDCRSLDFRRLVEAKLGVHLDKTRPRVRCLITPTKGSPCLACASGTSVRWKFE
jgi:hypothetical protein